MLSHRLTVNSVNGQTNNDGSGLDANSSSSANQSTPTNQPPGTNSSTKPNATTSTPTPSMRPPQPPAIPEQPNCNPNYTGCVPIASDVDCAGGSGDGPAYVKGPIQVIGSDVYRLDSDHDGIACE